MRANLGTETDTKVPVTIEAKIVIPAGTTVPAEALVQLYRHGEKLGGPKALPDSSEVEWTDTIKRQVQKTTVRYYVEFVDAIVDCTAWTGSKNDPVFRDRQR